MEYLLIILIVLLVGLVVFMLIQMQNMRRELDKPKDDHSLKVMMEWMKEIRKGTDDTRAGVQKTINETNREINVRLDKAASVIGHLQNKLGEMSQIGPDIKRLSEVLASPKLRGNFGEEMLEQMLADSLPQSAYTTQYRFKNGEVVDFILYIGEKILPIDSKFSLENYRLYIESKTESESETNKKALHRDIKKRIDEIHKKYILPNEGTFDFALMYVPSEGVFHEVMKEITIIEYARNKKVYLASPNSLYHHLQIVLTTLKGQKINEAAEGVLRMIASVRQESDKFEKQLGVLSNHIKNAGNAMGTVGSDYVKLKNAIDKTSDIETLKLGE